MVGIYFLKIDDYFAHSIFRSSLTKEGEDDGEVSDSAELLDSQSLFRYF